MSAITSHLEQQNDPSETTAERRYLSRGTFEQKVEADVITEQRLDGRRGLGAYAGEYPLTPDAMASLQSSHAEQLRVSFTRKAIMEELRGMNYEVHTKGREVFLSLERSIGSVPAWNPPGAGNMKNFRLLSWTQKMGTPSFSLPAGAAETGGSCPGAVGGQSVAPEAAMLAGQRKVSLVTGLPVSLADSVCQRCYATGGNYGYGSMQLTQLMRYMWARSTTRGNADAFVETMSWAVANAKYHLGGVLMKGSKKEGADISVDTRYERERHPGRYFRIHDSGDFFDERYLQAWKRVANNFRGGSRQDEITFWAPTRIWATSWGKRAVNEINGDKDSNLIIRPSSFHINEAPPTYDLGAGWAAWSVVYTPEVKAMVTGRGSSAQGHSRAFQGKAPYNWDCQAYSVVNEAHSCRNARGPVETGGGEDGHTGCRACWIAPDKVINYTEH